MRTAPICVEVADGRLQISLGVETIARLLVMSPTQSKFIDVTDPDRLADSMRAILLTPPPGSPFPMLQQIIEAIADQILEDGTPNSGINIAHPPGSTFEQ